MKNKIIAYAAMALILVPAVSHARWGTDFTASSWEMDAKDLETTKATYLKALANGSYTGIDGDIVQDKMGGSASFFVEGNSRVRLGLSAGYGAMPEVSAKVHKRVGTAYTHTELRTKTAYVPVALYLKFGSKGGGSSFFAGGGGDFVTVNTKYELTGSAGTLPEEATFTQKKVIPHAQAGFEFFLAKWLSFGVNAKYVFNGVLDNMTGDLKRNRISQGKKQMAMANEGAGGVHGIRFGYKNTGYTYTGKQRPFEYDYSGLRLNLAMRWYFGGGKSASTAPVQRTDQVKTQVIGEKVTPEPVQAPAPAVNSADSDALKLEREKLELEKAKLKLEQDKFDFEKQSGKKE